MCEECVPPIPGTRLIGCSIFGDALGCVKAAVSNDIQEITSLGGCLMWNNAAVCGGRVRLDFFVRVCLDMWRSLERESTIMFSVTFMCCEYRDVLLLTRVQTSQQDTSLCDYALTRSNDALCIQTSVLELYVNAKMCEPCPSCRIVM